MLLKAAVKPFAHQMSKFCPSEHGLPSGFFHEICESLLEMPSENEDVIILFMSKYLDMIGPHTCQISFKLHSRFRKHQWGSQVDPKD